LTVGIEIHAQLNTSKKLFSGAPNTFDLTASPNTQVSFFDLAIPGSQPVFQRETLIPALRAAIALGCEIQHESKFDRKHYFHWDQPAGYQITQYYSPFALNGSIKLYAHDGIAPEDGQVVEVGIKQIQMEQDTAKTISTPSGEHLLDFNRAGSPLIEIITLPHIHSAATAAAYVRKIQAILVATDSCVLGMESGGLRADVNVSVRKRGTEGNAPSYSGVSGLGTRTEIKNLSSFKSIKDAITAEARRQISVLEAGGNIEGETRGWTIGGTETRRLRGKEGEVDYRYMPDADIPPLIIGSGLVAHLRKNLPVLPDEEITTLTEKFGLSTKDALTLLTLEDGARLDFYHNVLDSLLSIKKISVDSGNPKEVAKMGKSVGNWVLHELGSVISSFEVDPDNTNHDQSNPGSFLLNKGEFVIPANEVAVIINFLDGGEITGKTAKQLLSQLMDASVNGHRTDIETMIIEQNLWFHPLSEAEYDELAKATLEDKILAEILKKGADGKGKGKVMYWVGRMMREGEEGRVEPNKAEEAIRRILDAEVKKAE
jgi:aspartyl-tRNA(Asn)/glutamyl-tRNA(Gln) amidotransferase subunit B